MKLQKTVTAFLFGLFLAPLFWFSLPLVHAQTSELEKLKQDIQDRGSRLADIEKEIAKFELQLMEVGAEKQSLQKAINQLTLERKKVQAEISRTETLISSTDLEINKLILEISKTEKDIDTNKEAIAEIIRAQYKTEDLTLVELLLRNKKFSEFWNSLEAHKSVQNSMAIKVEELVSLHKLLDEKREESTQKRNDLKSLHSQYKDQNVVLTNNQAEQADLLEVTKNEEKNYQQLLAEKQQAREQIVKEIRDYETKLKFFLDPNSVPTPGTAVFAWPLKNIIITQYFGGSEFAKRNPGIYGGRAYHPGIDLSAPRGTAIYAPLSGTVRATGNTDIVPGCYSWGKWTLIDHANGLSTLYAHQDVQSVSPGQKVTTGDIIGYTGNTGFSTGPHLHFTVYAKDGVSVRKFNEIKTVTSCGPASTPVAASDAYLDPVLYLPPQ
ncbi:MAG: peptidoglycan DD-metalloendopeptidase family protein [Candidatus Nomurabacteria bacterium]|nr:MAG: peptidoglycan DD-metalloendopeptidase family protein [Candidatus Nomurabacteria bacterium]